MRRSPFARVLVVLQGTRGVGTGVVAMDGGADGCMRARLASVPPRQ